MRNDEIVLVKWNRNDKVVGFVIMTHPEWKEYKQTARQIKKGFSIYIETEDDTEEYVDGRALLSKLTAEYIYRDEAEIIERLVGKEFGCVAFNDGCINDFLDNAEDHIGYHIDYRSEVSDFLDHD